MKKNLLLPIFLVLLFSSCSEDDGDVEPMKWKTEVKKSSDGYIHLSCEGGTCTFQCTNYSSFWITSVTEQKVGEDGKRFNPRWMDTEDLYITSNWLTAQRDGTMLTVTILPTTLDANRYMKVSVQNGDTFDEFKFKQRGLKVGV